MAPDTQPYVMHGLSHSYFTGKLQAYFQAKGLPYRFVEMDVADFRRCAQATGVAQMPQVETPNGEWLTDTTPTIAHLEASVSGLLLRPPRLLPISYRFCWKTCLMNGFGGQRFIIGGLLRRTCI